MNTCNVSVALFFLICNLTFQYLRHIKKGIMGNACISYECSLVGDFVQ